MLESLRNFPLGLPKKDSELPSPVVAAGWYTTNSRLRAVTAPLKAVWKDFKWHLQSPSSSAFRTMNGSVLDELEEGTVEGSGETTLVDPAGKDEREVRQLEDGTGRTECIVVSGDISGPNDWEGKLQDMGHGPEDNDEPISPSEQESAAQPEEFFLSSSTHFRARAAKSTRGIEKWILLHILCPVNYYFNLSFDDERQEKLYQDDLWARSKLQSIWVSFFYTFLYATSLIFTPKPLHLVDIIVIYGLGSFFSLLLPFLVIYDWPQTRPLMYQSFLFCATYLFPLGSLGEAFSCGYRWGLPSGTSHCQNNDFTDIMLLAVCYPVLAMYSLKMSRVRHLMGSIAFSAFASALATQNSISWGRNVLNFFSFSVFTDLIAFFRDRGDRRLYQLRKQLRFQYQQTQKAQAQASQASESKKRFVNYIFHEIRVPLNTSLLAVQNLEAEGILDARPDVDIDVEKSALVGGLSIVKQILDDTLDFSSLDSGIFKFISRPFCLYRCIKSMTGIMKVEAERRGVKFVMEWDEKISQICGSGGMVCGDEMRLRQLVSNLTSNANKYVYPNGSVVLRLQLVFPALDSSNDRPALPTSKSGTGSTNDTYQRRRIVVRIEVEDSDGPGIAQEDMENAKLFSPYVQTEIGRAKGGGKGTGLGLAVVRHIVTLSKGRLGVISKVGQGSTFWIELPFLLPETPSQVPVIKPPPIMKPPPLSRLSSSYKKSTLKSLRSKSTAGSDILLQVQPLEAATPSSTQPSTPSTNLSSDGDSPPPATATTAPLSTLAPPLISSPLPTPEPEAVSVNQQPSISSSLSDNTNTPSDKLRVLVVDDDPMTQKLMSRMLSRLGHSSHVAENGQQAVEQVLASSDFHYDLIFLDNFMPVKSGVEAICEIRQNGRKEFVVGATGNATASDQEEYLNAGLNHLLTKPIMKSSLDAALSMAKQFKLDRLQRSLSTLPT